MTVGDPATDKSKEPGAITAFFRRMIPFLESEKELEKELMSSKKLVDSLTKFQVSRFELWKYFEARADQIGDRLWTIGVWLMTIIGATLALPFAAKFVTFPEGGLVRVTAPLPVAFISGVGVVLVVYSYIALLDMQAHVSRNWERSRIARELEPELRRFGGRKRDGWWVLVFFCCAAFAAFVALFILACVGPDPAAERPL